MDNQINNISVQKWSFYTPFLYCFKFTLSRHTKYPNTITIITPLIPAEKIQKTNPLLISNLVVTLLHSFYIHKYVDFNFSAINNIVKPALWIAIGLIMGKLVSYIFSFADCKGLVFCIFSAGTPNHSEASRITTPITL